MKNLAESACFPKVQRKTLLYFAMLRGNLKTPWKDTEFRVYIGLLAVCVFVVTLNLAGVQGRPPTSPGTASVEAVRTETVTPPAPGDQHREKLLAAGAQAQVIQFNPNAALQKHIFADSFVPNSPEFEIDLSGVRYVAQRAEHLGTGKVRVYYVPKGDWTRVRYVQR